MIKENEKKMLLILDLDETLIHSSEEKIKGVEPDFCVDHFFVYKRPYLEDFLRFCDKHFKLAVWSSATDDYVKEIVMNIFPSEIKLEFIWGRSRCTFKKQTAMDESAYINHSDHYDYTKQIKKVKRRGYDLSKVLIIDDTPSKVANCFGNAIYIDEFSGVPDSDLKLLADYLKRIKDVENVRKIEKRFWKKSER